METPKVIARVYVVQMEPHSPRFIGGRDFHALPREGEYIPMDVLKPMNAMNTGRVMAVMHDITGPLLYVQWSLEIHMEVSRLTGEHPENGPSETGNFKGYVG